MRLTELNRITPIVHTRIMNNVPGFLGTTYEYRHVFYAAKHKNKYLAKDRYITSERELPLDTVTEMFKKSTQEYVKAGRYTDYFYVERAGQIF